MHLQIFIFLIIIAIIFILKNNNKETFTTDVRCMTQYNPGWPCCPRPYKVNDFHTGYVINALDNKVKERKIACKLQEYYLQKKLFEDRGGAPINPLNTPSCDGNPILSPENILAKPCNYNQIEKILTNEEIKAKYTGIGEYYSKDREKCKASIEQYPQYFDEVCDPTKKSYCCENGSCYDTCKDTKNKNKWGTIHSKICCNKEGDPTSYGYDKSETSRLDNKDRPSPQWGWDEMGCKDAWRAPDTGVSKTECSNKIASVKAEREEAERVERTKYCWENPSTDTIESIYKSSRGYEDHECSKDPLPYFDAKDGKICCLAGVLDDGTSLEKPGPGWEKNYAGCKQGYRGPNQDDYKQSCINTQYIAAHGEKSEDDKAYLPNSVFNDKICCKKWPSSSWTKEKGEG